MRRAEWMITCAVLTAGCGPTAIDDDAGPGIDAAVADGGSVDHDGGSPTDGAAPDGSATDGGGGEVTVRCYGFDGPTLVVTRPFSGSGPSEVLLRLDLGFEGGATAIRIDEVVQRDAAGEEIRRWDPASLAPPPGFDGTAPTRDGVPSPRVLFSATETATAAEVAVCDGDWWERAPGQVDVVGQTAEGGRFEVTCGLGWDPDAADQTLRYACARGVAGYLTNTYDAISDIATPIDAVLMMAEVGAFASGGTIDGFVATEVDVRARQRDTFDPCPEPSDWAVTGGTHNLWRGTSSTDTWSGPVAAGIEERFWWDWQGPGSAPSGLCVPPDDGTEPPTDCGPPSLQIVLRGTSSAGPWEWESDSFWCYDLTGT